MPSAPLCSRQRRRGLCSQGRSPVRQSGPALAPALNHSSASLALKHVRLVGKVAAASVTVPSPPPSLWLAGAFFVGPVSRVPLLGPHAHCAPPGAPSSLCASPAAPCLRPLTDPAARGFPASQGQRPPPSARRLQTLHAHRGSREAARRPPEANVVPCLPQSFFI